MTTTIFSGMTDDELWRFADNTASTPLELELTQRLAKHVDHIKSLEGEIYSLTDEDE